jgi:PEP-CTERM motif
MLLTTAKSTLLLALALTIPASAVTVLTENFDSRTVGTTVSTGVYFETTAVTGSGSITFIAAGNNGLTLDGNYSPAPNGYYGTYVNSNITSSAGPTAATVVSLSDYTYSFTVFGSEAGQIDLAFHSRDGAGVSTGISRKGFNITTTPTTYTGNLAEAGWAIQGYGAGGSSLIALSASSYSVFFQQSGYGPGGPGSSWGQDSGNLVTLDNISLQAVPEPSSLLVLGSTLLGFVVRRRRSVR